MYFHQAIARTLKDQGIDDIFGLLGDANLFMMEFFGRATGGRFHSVAHESAAVLAANGYARTSGRLGVASVTHGAALTNTVTALVESVKDRTPLLLVAGDTAVTDRDNWHNHPQRDVVLAAGGGFEQVRAPETMAEDVVTAVRRAWLERRPIALNVPTDFQWADVEYQFTPARFVPPQALAPDPAALDEAMGVIASARRPIVVAGQGATSGPAKTALIALARRLGAPLGTTLRAKDLFRGDEFDLGIVGTLSHEVALDAINRSDCVIAFGASLNTWTMAHGSFAAKRQIVHVDIDRENIGRFTHPTVAVVGDATAVAERIIGHLDEADVPATGFASLEMAEAIVARSDGDFEDVSGNGTIDIRTALLHVDQSFPADRTLVVDAGRFVMHCFTRVHVPHPTAYVHAANFASVGLGMGNAIGAAVGAPDRPTLMFCGDGGLMLGGLAEFNTAVRHGLDLVVVVLNDGAYGAEHLQLRARGMDTAASEFDWPEFAPLAVALGGQGYTARTVDELDQALAAIESRTTPVLIDVKLDPDKVEMVGI